MYWTISGYVKPSENKESEVRAYLTKIMNHVEVKEDDRIEFDFDGKESWQFRDLVVNKLAPDVEEGQMTAHDSDLVNPPTRYYFQNGQVHSEIACELVDYFPGSEEEFAKLLPHEVVSAVLRLYGKQELRVETPAGPIMAKVMPDDEYPGIIVMNEKEPGQPAAILEYSPTADGDTKSCMQLRVYDEVNPDDEPVAIYQMSRDLRTKETNDTQQGWINDGKIERLWDGMTDIPFDEDEDGDLCISQDYGPFFKGDSREYIWYWFDKKHSKGIHYLLYEREDKNVR